MATILEMTAEIVAAHASTTNMTRDEITSELCDVYSAFSSLDKGKTDTKTIAEEQGPAVLRSNR